MSHPLTKCGVCGNPNLRTGPVARIKPAHLLDAAGRSAASRGDALPAGPHVLRRLHARAALGAVDPEVVFPADYPYSSGNSKALHENFEDLAQQASVIFGRGRSCRGHRRERRDAAQQVPDCRTVGVEPTEQARQDPPGWWYYGLLHERRSRSESWRSTGQAKVITACNVLAHVEDIHDVMRGITPSARP